MDWKAPEAIIMSEDDVFGKDTGGSEKPDYPKKQHSQDSDESLEEELLVSNEELLSLTAQRESESETTAAAMGQLDGLEKELKSIEVKTLSKEIKESIKKQRESVKLLMKKLKSSSDLKKHRRKLQKKLRKAVTGNEEKRVRDHIREKRKEPPVIKILDKIFFTIGVGNLVVSEYFLLMFPQHFGLWFAFIIPTMLILRFFYYKTLKWRYFMIDFCYFTQGTILFAMILPSDWELTKHFYRMNFLYASGPLAISVPAWGNKLVFHDMDKVVTVAIHALPMWLLYSQRWYGQTTLMFESYGIWDFLFAVAGYCLWQMLYFYKTEMRDKEIFEADPSIQTSLRWLASDEKNAMHRIVINLMRATKLMDPDEYFDSKTVKTKIIFMASQLAYTLLTFLPCLVIYNNFIAHTTYGLVISTWAVWNGASYYIDVFSCRYQKKLTELQKAKKEE